MILVGFMSDAILRLRFRCGARCRFGKGVPAIGIEGKRLDFSGLALYRQGLALEFKIERPDVAGLNNDLLSRPDSFFGERSQGLLRGHFAVHINRYPGIFPRSDLEDNVPRNRGFCS